MLYFFMKYDLTLLIFQKTFIFISKDFIKLAFYGYVFAEKV